MVKAKLFVLKHIDLFDAEKAQALRDLAAQHAEQRLQLSLAQEAEVDALVGGLARQRELDVVEAVGSYTAAGLRVPQQVLDELSRRNHPSSIVGSVQVSGLNYANGSC